MDNMSGKDQGDERKQTTDDVSKSMRRGQNWMGSSIQGRRKSPRETCLLLGWPPALRWRDLDSGSCAERGKLCFDEKGKA